MAVIFKTDLTLTKLVTALWTPDASEGGMMNLAEKLEAASFSLKTSPSNLTVIHTNKAGKEFGASSCEVKYETLVLAAKGKVGYSVKVALREKINLLINNAHQWLTQHDVVPVTGSFTEAANAGDDYDTSLGALIDKQAQAAADPISLSQENPTYKSLKSHVMKLEDAEHLHQAVHGTTSGSRYYVIALGDNAKVAARIKSATDISIKAICTASTHDDITKVIAGFERAALAKAGAGHYSLHLNPTNMEMAERSIGATLFAMGIPFWAVTGHVAVLTGK